MSNVFDGDYFFSSHSWWQRNHMGYIRMRFFYCKNGFFFVEHFLSLYRFSILVIDSFCCRRHNRIVRPNPVKDYAHFSSVIANTNAHQLSPMKGKMMWKISDVKNDLNWFSDAVVCALCELLRIARESIWIFSFAFSVVSVGCEMCVSASFITLFWVASASV